MSDTEARKLLETAKSVAVEVEAGMKRPPGTKEIGNAVINGQQRIYYYNGYTYPNYYVRIIRCEEDLKPWK